MNKMKRDILWFCMSLAIGLTACDFAGVLSSEKSSPTPQTSDRNQLDTLLSVEVTGGIAGVYQKLVVDSSGLVTYTDSFRPGAEWVAQLSRTELKNLKQLFTENDFSSLEDVLLDEQVADAFYYEISFTANGTTKTVLTDRFAAPKNLQTIVDGILQLVAKLTENGPQLELALSSDHLKHGESMDLQLVVSNPNDEIMILKFSSGQIFDFEARQDITNDTEPVWNWAKDMAFTAALTQLELEPGESKSYQISWDGRDNSGELLSGAFYIVGKLVSVPGGTTRSKTLLVSE